MLITLGCSTVHARMLHTSCSHDSAHHAQMLHSSRSDIPRFMLTQLCSSRSDAPQFVLRCSTLKHAQHMTSVVPNMQMPSARWTCSHNSAHHAQMLCCKLNCSTHAGIHVMHCTAPSLMTCSEPSCRHRSCPCMLHQHAHTTCSRNSAQLLCYSPHAS